MNAPLETSRGCNIAHWHIFFAPAQGAAGIFAVVLSPIVVYLRSSAVKIPHELFA